MKIALHYFDEINKDNYARKWLEILKQKNIEVKTLNLLKSFDINDLKECDGLMWHWYHLHPEKIIAPKILNAVQFGLNIPVFPDIHTDWHFDDKVGQYFLLNALNAPIVKSWFFSDKAEAIKFLDSATFPLIFKLSVGAGSVNVFKLNTKDEALAKIDEMFDQGVYPYSSYEYELGNKYTLGTNKFGAIKDILLNKNITKHINREIHWYYQMEKNYFYIQEFLVGNNFDIRVTIIGDRAFAFRRYNRDNDFRASGSGKINYELNEIPLEAIKIAFEVSKKGKFQSMAYDFLYDKERNLRIVEISYAYVNKAVYECSGHWDSALNFHEGNMWPEEAQVEDFINFINSNK